MQTRKKMLDKKHLDTLSSMNNLVFILKEQNQNAKIINLMQEYIYLRSRILDVNYFHILSFFATLTK